MKWYAFCPSMQSKTTYPFDRIHAPVCMHLNTGRSPNILYDIHHLHRGSRCDPLVRGSTTQHGVHGVMKWWMKVYQWTVKEDFKPLPKGLS